MFLVATVEGWKRPSLGLLWSVTTLGTGFSRPRGLFCSYVPFFSSPWALLDLFSVGPHGTCNSEFAVTSSKNLFIIRNFFEVVIFFSPSITTSTRFNLGIWILADAGTEGDPIIHQDVLLWTTESIRFPSVLCFYVGENKNIHLCFWLKCWLSAMLRAVMLMTNFPFPGARSHPLPAWTLPGWGLRPSCSVLS